MHERTATSNCSKPDGRAWEVSERLGGPLDLLYVEAEPQADHLELSWRVDDLRRLAAVFGAQLMVDQDRDIARAVLRVTARAGTTHLVMHKRFGIRQRSPVDEIVERAPTLQLVLVGDPQSSRASSR
jgi:K+-sensing histidine kinase KdpD